MNYIVILFYETFNFKNMYKHKSHDVYDVFLLMCKKYVLRELDF